MAERGYSRWGKRYAQEAEVERRKRKGEIAGKKRVAAHQRRAAGKVVHVRGYCRRPAKVARKVGTARQTGGDWGF